MGTVRCRDHTLRLQGCGGGAPFRFLILHGEGGFLRPRKNFLCLLGKCVSVRTKNGIGILTYYRGGVLVGVGIRVGDL